LESFGNGRRKARFKELFAHGDTAHTRRGGLDRCLLRSAVRLEELSGSGPRSIFFDVLLVTWLVWITGNANSPYAALYIVIISVASLFVGPAARDYFDGVSPPSMAVQCWPSAAGLPASPAKPSPTQFSLSAFQMFRSWWLDFWRRNSLPAGAIRSTTGSRHPILADCGVA
jgi:hypothetical protein